MDDSADVGDETPSAATGPRAASGRGVRGVRPEPTAGPARDFTGTADLSGPLDDLGTTLIDLSGLSLGDLDAVGQTALGTALRRVVARGNEPTDPVVGFQSSI